MALCWHNKMLDFVTQASCHFTSLWFLRSIYSKFKARTDRLLSATAFCFVWVLTADFTTAQISATGRGKGQQGWVGKEASLRLLFEMRL